MGYWSRFLCSIPPQQTLKIPPVFLLVLLFFVVFVDDVFEVDVVLHLAAAEVDAAREDAPGMNVDGLSLGAKQHVPVHPSLDRVGVWTSIVGVFDLFRPMTTNNDEEGEP